LRNNRFFISDVLRTQRKKNVEAALNYSTNALGKISGRRDSDILALEHRIKRLNKKIGKKAAK